MADKKLSDFDEVANLTEMLNGFIAVLAKDQYGDLKNRKLPYAKLGDELNNMAAAIALKASKTLSDATPAQAFINQAIMWGMPDYTAGVLAVTQNNTVAAYDAIIIMKPQRQDNNAWYNLHIDGAHVGAGDTSSYNHIRYIPFLLPKGSTYLIQGNWIEGVIYPLRGA